jgi:hypothetical protein
VPHPLQTCLVVTDAEGIDFGNTRLSKRLQMVVLAIPADANERQKALLGERVVQLELAQFDVEPGASGEIIQPRPDRLEVEAAELVGRSKYIERKILRQRTGGMKVQARAVEALAGDFGHVRAGAVTAVHGHLIGTVALAHTQDSGK